MLQAHSKNAIVIGSGIAGMAAAVRLAVMGFQVSLYETNGVAGGKLSVFENKGYHFDAGPSLFTQPQNIEDLFDLAGEPVDEYFKYTKCDTTCNYFYENGKRVTAYSDAHIFASELQEKLGEDMSTTKKYLRAAGNLYNELGQVFLNYSLHKKSTWFNKRIFRAIKAVKFSYLFSSLHTYNRTKFSSPEAAQLFNRYATYNGSNPYKAPAMLSLIPHLEHNEGIFYPLGGMINIAGAVYKLAQKKGVVFHFNTAVLRIIEHAGRAKGIVVNDKNVYADVVISNTDVYFTYKNLLRNTLKANQILRQERSSSALIFYWGIKKSFSQLQLHNIFFSENYVAEFDHIFNKKKVYSDPTVYLNITAKHDKSHAPANSENWFVMVNVPANTGQDWAAIKTAVRQNVILKLSRLLGNDIEPLIETENIADPLTIEATTGSYMGSLYGTSSNSKMAAFFRHPNFTTAIKNLYFCGGSVHPGGGIPLCFKSAKIAVDIIQQDLKIPRH